ncbi:MAG: hypothetical protein HJJLKODD_01093 [Phycisphaerae bacterium]|nr:hypothetical protein [Phycisphaerae bacterium]
MKDRTNEVHELTLREIIPRPLDRQAIWILILAALVLTASRYFGNFAVAQPTMIKLLSWVGVEQAAERIRQVFLQGDYSQLHQLWYWAGFHVVIYLLIPAAMVRLVFGASMRDYGLKLSGWYRRLWIYGAAFLIVLAMVLIFGRTESFKQYYPMYKQAHRSTFDFLGWEIAYIAQFFALEYFFRGLLIHGLKHRFGIYTVLVAMVPYCMIHFGKPLPETIGAIIAGIFLGVLSLWTRSIWLGFLIHISVALSMDLAALHYKGQLAPLLGI